MEECNLHTIVRLPNSVFRPYASIGTNLLFFEKGKPTKDIWFYEHLVPQGQKAYSMTRPIRLEHLQGCIDWWGGADRQGRAVTERAWKVASSEVKARGYNLNQYQGGMCISGRLTMTERIPRDLISPLGPNWVGTDSAV